MKLQHKKCMKNESGLFNRTLETFEDPLRQNQQSINPSGFTRSIYTYEELKELKLTLAKFELQKAEIIERLRTRFL